LSDVVTPTAVEPMVVTTPAPIAVMRRRMPIRKRLLDLSIAIPAALITLPITVGLAAVSWVKYRQFPLFHQSRVGHGGQEFTFWKIRTLPRVAPDTADKYQLQALTIPRFAQQLRNHHLDELLQLWLVIAGKMSIVGPRPEMPTLSASFDQSFVAERVSIKPGCTGLWQVSLGSRGLIGESPEWDLHYAKFATLRLDLWIMLRTVLMMANTREVTSLNDIPRWTGAAVS
jgi:lipopolysaccharide/colanic/teichoic acid biosynthesis glycosyltransferase